jgi:Zn finger protein HypA/HybF involved in hydrogenase expression
MAVEVLQMNKSLVFFAPDHSGATSQSQATTHGAHIFECEDCHMQIGGSIQDAHRCECCGEPFFYCPVCGGSAALVTDGNTLNWKVRNTNN